MNIDPVYWGESLWKIMYCIGASLPHSNANLSEQRSNDLYAFFTSLKTLIPCENCRSNYAIDMEKIPFPKIRNTNTVCEWVHSIEKETNVRLNKPTLSLADRLKNMQQYMTPIVDVQISTLLESVPTELNDNHNKIIQSQKQLRQTAQPSQPQQPQQPSHQNNFPFTRDQLQEHMRTLPANYIRVPSQEHNSRQIDSSSSQSPSSSHSPILKQTQPQAQPQPQPQPNKKTMAPKMSKINKMVLRSGGRVPKTIQKVHPKMPKQISLKNKADLRYLSTSQARPQKPCNCGNKIL